MQPFLFALYLLINQFCQRRKKDKQNKHICKIYFAFFVYFRAFSIERLNQMTEKGHGRGLIKIEYN